MNVGGHGTMTEARRSRRLVCWCFAAVVLWPGCCAMAGELFPRDRVLLPFTPAAMAQGPSALRFNPSALGSDPEFALDYYHTYSDSSFHGNDALYAALRGIGVAIEWYGADRTPAGHSYTIGLATSAERALALGSSYQWRSSDDPVQDKSHFWSHGLWWRPNNRLALAVVVDNYNRMKVHGERSDARFAYSAAWRFLDRRLTVGGDWYQQTSEALFDGTYRVGAAWEVTDGLTLYADVGRDRSYSLGGRLNLTSFLTGSHATFDRHDGWRGGVACAGIRSQRQRPLVHVRREVVHLDLTGAIPDRRPPRLLFGRTPYTTWDWIDMLGKAETDPSIRAVVLRIQDPELGWARRRELRQALARVRAAGKFTVAYCDGNITNSEYYLATAADRIVVPPVSTVDLVGLKSEVVFATRLLGKLGIVADLEHVGEYKTASDLLTRTDMSPAHREALNALLDDLDSCWVAEMAQSRGVSSERVRAWIDHGPYVSVDARGAGLIDEVIYADRLDSLVRACAGPVWGHVTQAQLAGRHYATSAWTHPRVAVVFASGSMVEGVDGTAPLWGDVMGERTIVQAIRRAAADRRVKAIVLRIDSGGGSIFAADAIWREVAQARAKKPVVVSLADVAASGGYYIACAADSIFAQPNTITGSIGVIAGKLDLSGLYDKAGLDREVLTRGPYAAMYSAGRAFDSTERVVVRDQMLRAYGRFVSIVAAGRHLAEDSVDAIGQGRVWSGTAACGRGLVDRHADLREVIAVAARMGRIESGDAIGIQLLPRPEWRLFDAGPLAQTNGLGSMGGFLRSALGSFPLTSWIASDANVRYELPYSITVR
ncbi:MAG: signal peptide peptidase SppA [Candidatus Zixiibacteriota bacterium]